VNRIQSGMPALNECTDNLIVHLTLAPYDKREQRRLGIELFQQHDYSVYVWDLSEIMCPLITKGNGYTEGIGHDSCYRQFNNKKAVLAAIDQLPEKCMIISWVGLSSKTYSIFRAISARKIRYVIFGSNSLPLVSRNKTILNKLRKLDYRKILDSLFARIPLGLLKVKSAYMVLLDGQEAINKRFNLTDCKTKRLWLHTLDYDVYLELKEEVNKSNNNNCVFLDDYLPYHPDFIMMNEKPPVESRQYYSDLESFFSHVEDRLGVTVVIAAHPRSNYTDKPHAYKNRKVIYGATAQLVRDSCFVIAHASTAINYAVLFKKPIVFIKTNELDLHICGAHIETMASCFNKKTINVSCDCAVDWRRELIVDQIAYNNYLRNYIKKDETIQKPFWKIFIDEINNAP